MRPVGGNPRDQKVVAFFSKAEREQLEQLSRTMRRSLSDTLRELVQEKAQLSANAG